MDGSRLEESERESDSMACHVRLVQIKIPRPCETRTRTLLKRSARIRVWYTACFVLPAGDMLRENDSAGQLLQATRSQA